MKGVGAVAALLVIVPSTGVAQSALDATAGVNTSRKTQSSAVVTLASAVIPGSGQALLGQKRSAIYIALEAAGIAYYVSQNRDGNRQRREYRSLARNVARAGFSPSGPEGSWDYYERMEKYLASGAFDRVPGGDVDPEIDSETFNGAAWLLARQTYWRDPAVAPAPQSAEYRAAIDFYLDRAVTPEFLWSWSSDPSAFQSYRAAIAGSNGAFRNAEQTASLLIANHFLSAVDAFASARMRVRRDGQGTTTLSASLRF